MESSFLAGSPRGTTRPSVDVDRTTNRENASGPRMVLAMPVAKSGWD